MGGMRGPDCDGRKRPGSISTKCAGPIKNARTAARFRGV